MTARTDLKSIYEFWNNNKNTFDFIICKYNNNKLMIYSDDNGKQLLLATINKHKESFAVDIHSIQCMIYEKKDIAEKLSPSEMFIYFMDEIMEMLLIYTPR